MWALFVIAAFAAVSHGAAFSYSHHTQPIAQFYIYDTPMVAQPIPPAEKTKDLPCSAQGFFVHPTICDRFYRCVDYIGSGTTFSSYEFVCPKGMVFVTENTNTCVPGDCQGSGAGSIAQGTPSETSSSGGGQGFPSGQPIGTISGQPIGTIPAGGSIGSPQNSPPVTYPTPVVPIGSGMPGVAAAEPGDIGALPVSVEDSQPGSVGGSQPGSVGGSQPGSVGGSQPGSVGGSQPGSVGGSQPGSVGGSQPGSVGGSQPGSVGGSQPGSVGGSQPGSVGGSQPGSAGGSQPGSVGGFQPGSVGGSQPASVGGSQPGSVGVSQPGSSVGGSQPGSSVGGSQPGSSVGGSQPGSSVGGSQPGSSVGGSQPGSSVGGSQPGSVGGSQPGSVGGSQPGSVGGSQPGSVGGSQPGSVGDSQPGSFGGSQPGSVGGSQPGSVGGSQPGSVVGSQPGSVGGSQPGSVGGAVTYPPEVVAVPGVTPESHVPQPSNPGSQPAGGVGLNPVPAPVASDPSGGFVPTGSGYPQPGGGVTGGSVPSNDAVGGSAPGCTENFVQDSMYCNIYHSCPDDNKRYLCSQGSVFNEAQQLCDLDNKESLCAGKSFKPEKTFKVPNSILLSIRSDDIIPENSAACSTQFVQDDTYCNMYRNCPDDGKNYLCLQGTVFLQDQQRCDYDNQNLYCSGKQMKDDSLYRTSNSVILGGFYPNFKGLQPFIQPLPTFQSPTYNFRASQQPIAYHQQKPFAFSRPQQQPFTFNRQNQVINTPFQYTTYG